MKTIEVKREVVVREVTTKEEALNAIENLLVYEDLEVEKYETLNKLVTFLDDKNEFDLGEGLRIKLIDTTIEIKSDIEC